LLIPNDAAPLGIALLGLILGMRHATDADHVIAVTAIVSGERRVSAAARIGIAWGLGHSVTVFIVGGAIILFKLTIPPRLGMAMEFAVAIVLILLGISVLARSSPRIANWLGLKSDGGDWSAHSHAHEHDGTTHVHPHAHAHSDEHSHHSHRFPMPSRFARGSYERAFGVGLVHGLAGSAAIALLVLSAIPNPVWGLVYLAIFGFGTILGMALITTAIGLPVSLTAARLGGLNHALLVGAGLLSLGFGLFLAYQIGIVDGLFISGPPSI
jgi:ABC-type nickel/cobalt efflux system permease component RcnA